jgi:cell wall-associated NlpC family hydrolase
MDCSGLVQRVFADEGVALPRTAAEQSQMGTNVPSLSQALPGDLVFYGSPAEHVGIYIGNGQIINAPHSGQSVSITGVGTPTDIQRISPPALSQNALGLSPGSSLTESQVAAEVGVPAALEPIFAQATQRYGLPPGLLEAVGKVESNFNVNAVSSAGAQGLMQIMPQTAAGIGVNPTDPTQAINGAAQLLSEKLQTFGSVPLAVAAYNAGDGAVQRYQGIPPYSQTQNYVQSVMSYLGGA